MFSLESALEAWSRRDVVVTTALIEEQNFGFHEVNPNFYMVVQAELKISFRHELIQIALPQIYRHRPLYCVALYHELGHFVDRHWQLVNLSLLLAPPGVADLSPWIEHKPSEAANKSYQQFHINQRAEYFSDLFAAMFAGRGSTRLLQEFCGVSATSFTHPSTSNRVLHVESFLSGQRTPLLDLFEAALAALKLPKLQKRFVAPNIDAHFGNFRPYPIASDGEMHGILESGWTFLDRAEQGLVPAWSNFAQEDREEAVNDLVEKSVRNRIIKLRWDTAHSP